MFQNKQIISLITRGVALVSTKDGRNWREGENSNSQDPGPPSQFWHVSVTQPLAPSLFQHHSLLPTQLLVTAIMLSSLIPDGSPVSLLPAPSPAASPLQDNPEQCLPECQLPTTIKECILRTALHSLSHSLLPSCVPLSHSVSGKAIRGGRGRRNLVKGWKEKNSGQGRMKKQPRWGPVKKNKQTNKKSKTKKTPKPKSLHWQKDLWIDIFNI